MVKQPGGNVASYETEASSRSRNGERLELKVVDRSGLTDADWTGISPIIAEDGTAIGIVCTSGGPHGVPHTEGGPNPRLMGNLPGWFLASQCERPN